MKRYHVSLLAFVVATAALLTTVEGGQYVLGAMVIAYGVLAAIDMKGGK